ncbi:MAG: glycoside hydrolase family 2 protein [Phycisphaerae bacterium]
MDPLNLTENWTLKAVGDLADVPDSIRGRSVPATVPGCVHTALLSEGLIPDPYVGSAEKDLAWIGRTDWEYRCRFEVPAKLSRASRLDLVCEGLDTVAEVSLSGTPIGRSEDMHFPCVCDAAEAIREGENELVIVFRSAVEYARRQEQRLGTLPHSNTEVPHNFIRKMACNFSWDWGPELITAGPWRPIYLRAWEAARIDNVRPWVVFADADDAQIDVLLDVERAEPGWLRLSATLTDPQGQAFTQNVALREENCRTFVRLDVHDPQRWWPRGYGDQPLYELRVELTDREGRVVHDEWVGRVGLRTVDLDTGEDEVGRRMVIKVNGKQVFCRGANWIPGDCFLDRACTPERYRAAIGRAVDANMNMLRVWGGGIYETDAFYDICDELGVLVWQDYLFACAAYPEEEPFWTLVEQEARYNLARLMPHPSLVLWNGCNENLWGYLSWGWRDKGLCEGRTWGPGYYLDLLDEVTGEVDPSRPYWPASPYSGCWDPDDPECFPNLAHKGNMHVWNVWFGDNYDGYRKHTPRFCSEFGFQAPATYATLARVLPEDQLHRGSPGLRQHQKSRRADDRNDRFVEEIFTSPEGFDDWHFLLQLNQARALTTGVEWFRSRQPICMGTLYWQLNDCWPALSWAAVDGDGRPKPLWYATRRFYAPRLLTVQPHRDGLELLAVNDSDEPWGGEVLVSRMRFGGRPLAEQALAIDLPPRTCDRLAMLEDTVGMPDNPGRELVVADAAGARALWFFAADKDLDYPAPDLEAALTRDPEAGEYRLAIKARSLVRDLCVLVDRLDPSAEASDQLLTLLPGESAEVTIRSEADLTLQELTAPPVMQCANRFGR